MPGIAGIKQSSGDLKAVSDPLALIPPDKLVLTGIDALLYPSISIGMHGALTAAVPAPAVRRRRGDLIAAVFLA